MSVPGGVPAAARVVDAAPAEPAKAPVTAVAAPARVKPKLRGVSHEIAAFASVPAVISLVAQARGPRATLGATVYGFTLVALFTVSAVYHRRFWSLPARQLVGRFDHSAIFLLIAGTYTPFGLLLGPGAGHLALAVVWIGAVAGIVLVAGPFTVSKKARAAVYVLLGWVVVPLMPRLHEALGTPALGLLLGGGLCYTLGAVIYGARRPDPFPRIFGFHEIFHLLTIGAAYSHYLVVAEAVQRLGGR